MSKEKVIKEEVVEEKEIVQESAEKAKLRAHFEAYKLKNPVKYAMKKEAFEKQLASMK